MANHPNRSQIVAPEGAPARGSFVSIPFGARATQIAQVVGYGRDGSLKVRAWNATQGHWMPNARRVPMCPRVIPASATHLPVPPAL